MPVSSLVTLSIANLSSVSRTRLLTVVLVASQLKANLSSVSPLFLDLLSIATLSSVPQALLQHSDPAVSLSKAKLSSASLF